MVKYDKGAFKPEWRTKQDLEMQINALVDSMRQLNSDILAIQRVEQEHHQKMESIVKGITERALLAQHRVRELQATSRTLLDQLIGKQ